jgi:hypothetical protein
MILYYLNTTFSFGKHKGKTVKEVLEIEPSYIKWCILNLNHFCILSEVLKEIQVLVPEFKLNKREIRILNYKVNKWHKTEKYMFKFITYSFSN